MCIAERERETSSAEHCVPVGEQSPGRATVEGEEGDSGIDANSQGSCSSNEVKTAAKDRRKEKKKKKLCSNTNGGSNAGGGGGGNSAPNNIHPPPETRLPIASTSKPTVEVCLHCIQYYLYIHNFICRCSCVLQLHLQSHVKSPAHS